MQDLIAALLALVLEVVLTWLLPLLAARRPGELRFHPVGLRVNDPRNDDPRCLEDEPPPQQELF